MPAPRPPFKRLYENILKTPSGCMLWQGQVMNSGYGQIKAFTKMVACHRLSYELYYGQIPDGMEVCHTCDTPLCVNPDHLFVGTHDSNMKDMVKKGRRVQGKPNPRKGLKSKQSKQVLVLGKVYGSINEAEKALGLGNGTVNYWLKKKNGKAIIITLEEYEELKNG